MNKIAFMATSLPSELKAVSTCDICTIVSLDVSNKTVGVIFNENLNLSFLREIKDIKPILHPLSDLTKEIEHNGKLFIPIVELKNKAEIDLVYSESWYNDKDIDYTWNLPLWVIEKLIEWHFDIADLIAKGEAIDVNTLPKNPYK